VKPGYVDTGAVPKETAAVSPSEGNSDKKESKKKK
jgi:hypothetical protein